MISSSYQDTHDTVAPVAKVNGGRWGEAKVE